MIVTKADRTGRMFMLKYNYPGGGLEMVPLSESGGRLALAFDAAAVPSSDIVLGAKGIVASRLPDSRETDFYRLVDTHYTERNCQAMVMDALLGASTP